MPSATPYITPMPMAGFTHKWAYRAALARARFAHSWEDRLDALATAEKMRRRILAEQGRYRLSPSDFSMAPVRARAHRSGVRRALGAGQVARPDEAQAERLAA